MPMEIKTLGLVLERVDGGHGVGPRRGHIKFQGPSLKNDWAMAVNTKEDITKKDGMTESEGEMESNEKINK